MVRACPARTTAPSRPAPPGHHRVAAPADDSQESLPPLVIINVSNPHSSRHVSIVVAGPGTGCELSGVTPTMPVIARFEDLQHLFWDTNSDRGAQLSLTDQAILEAERLLNVTLPASLLDLLRKQNGGLVAPSWDAFPTTRPTSWAPDHVPFGSEQVRGFCTSNSAEQRPQWPPTWSLRAGSVRVLSERMTVGCRRGC